MRVRPFNGREQEAWDLLKDKIKSKSTEMRKVWTNDRKFDLASDDTRRYLDELIDLRSGVSSLSDRVVTFHFASESRCKLAQQDQGCR